VEEVVREKNVKEKTDEKNGSVQTIHKIIRKEKRERYWEE